MRTLFILRQEHRELARDEVLSLLGNGNVVYVQQGKFLLVDTGRERCATSERLAQTKAVYRVLFTCPLDELETHLDTFDWKRVCPSTLKVEVHGVPTWSSTEVGRTILTKLPHAKVDLTNPHCRLDIFFTTGTVICATDQRIVAETFDDRRSHHLPGHHPSGMHPRLARTIINLTGIRQGTIVDPLCGAGGILIEAALLGLRAVGFDNNPGMIERCTKNLTYLGLTADVSLSDMRTLKKKVDYVVTDVPYGHATRLETSFYPNFMTVLKRILKRRAVVMFPHYVPYEKMINKVGLRMRKEYSVYVHRSLTRKIIVIE